MKRVFGIRGAPAAALGVIALIIAASGVALAASPGGSITVCVHKPDGRLYRAKHCAGRDAKLSWSVTGPRGAPGSARGFAYVRSDGTVITKGGSIDIAIDRVKTGEDCLKMNPKPAFFAPIVATIQGPDLTAGLISVNSAVGSDCNPDGGFGVFTMNTAGAAADHDFVVAIM